MRSLCARLLSILAITSVAILLCVGESRADFQAYVGQFTTIDDTADSPQTVAGVGFTPKVLILFSASTDDATSDNSAFALGVATSTTSRFAIASNGATGALLSDENRRHENQNVFTFLSSTGTTTQVADLNEFNNDGFKLDFTTTTSARPVYFLALGGSDLTNATIVEFNMKDDGNGTDAIGGVGFTPDAIMIFGTQDPNAPANTAGSASVHMGMATPTDEAAIAFFALDNQATTDTSRRQRTDSVMAGIGSNQSDAFQANVDSFGADGFTLDYTNDSANAKYAWALCLKGGQYDVGSFTMPTTDGATKNISIGFEPSGLFAASWGTTASTSILTDTYASIGVASGSTQRRSIGIFNQDNRGGGSLATRAADSTSIIQILDGTKTIIQDVEIDAFTSDGFTIEQTEADGNANEVVYLAFGSTTGDRHTVLMDSF